MYVCDQQFVSTTLGISPQTAVSNQAALCRGSTVVSAISDDQCAFLLALPGLLDPAEDYTAFLLVVGSLYQSTRRSTAFVCLSLTVRSSNCVA